MCACMCMTHSPQALLCMHYQCWIRVACNNAMVRKINEEWNVLHCVYSPYHWLNFLGSEASNCYIDNEKHVNDINHESRCMYWTQNFWQPPLILPSSFLKNAFGMESRTNSPPSHPSSARVQGLPAYLYNYVIYRVTILVTKRLRLYLCYQLIITKL